MNELRDKIAEILLVVSKITKGENVYLEAHHIKSFAIFPKITIYHK